MWDKVWDFFVEAAMIAFMPLVCSYSILTENIFLNAAAENAEGFEMVGNTLLAPFQYIFAGREAIQENNGSWNFVPRFNYTDAFWPKALLSAMTLPQSLIFGAAVKGLGFLSIETRERHAELLATEQATEVHSNREIYLSLGLEIGKTSHWLISEGYRRKADAQNHLRLEKEALAAVAQLLTEADIPWWIDTGTCLGAYRYGGIIPWDHDLDIGVLLPDFDNVKRVLGKLDPTKYTVQDWSGREFPKSFLKVYIRETSNMIDIYHYVLEPTKKQLQYLFSLENNLFFPEWWKIRERRYKVPVDFATMFPLRKALFDGIEVFVPNDTKKYLQGYYGENLAPAKIYDEVTGSYEKDLTHPYWQLNYAH